MYHKKQLFLSVIVLLTFFSITAGCHRSDIVVRQDQERNAKIAVSLQNSGVLSKEDYLRVVRLDADVSSGGSLSEADAGWLLSLPDRPGTPYQTGIRLLHASTVFKHGKAEQFPASQRQKIFDMAVRMLPYKKETVTTAVPFSGCMVLGILGDPKAIPVLQKMLNSPYWEVRDTAKHSIAKIEKKAG